MTNPNKPDLHAQCVAAGIPIESHCSDLYIPVNEATRKLVAEYAAAGGTRATIFTSNIDGKPWYDVPFAFSPYWQAKQAESERRANL